MKTPLLTCLCLALVACGPSAKEIESAKTARYSCSFDEVFEAARAATEETFSKLAAVDSEQGVIASEARWHTKEGARKKAGVAFVDAGDVLFSIAVGVTSEEQGYRIVVEPSVATHVVGSPMGQRISRDDADWPAWADERADGLTYKIHQRLKGCTAGGTAPAE